jgi:hypothetical protein
MTTRDSAVNDSLSNTFATPTLMAIMSRIERVRNAINMCGRERL